MIILQTFSQFLHRNGYSLEAPRLVEVPLMSTNITFSEKKDAPPPPPPPPPPAPPPPYITTRFQT